MTDICWVFRIFWNSSDGRSVTLVHQTPSGVRTIERVHACQALVAQTTHLMGFPDSLIPGLLENFDWSGSQDCRDSTVPRRPQRRKIVGWTYQLRLHKGRNALQVIIGTPSGNGKFREISMQTVQRCGNDSAFPICSFLHKCNTLIGFKRWSMPRFRDSS